jgi:Na+-driven multidrug efflux pump
MIISTLGSTAAMLANARQLMTPQIIAVMLSAGINIVTTIWLIPYIGVEGAVYGTIIAYLLGVVPIYCIVLPKALH